jgi:para-nitrobenzyl esterase
VITVSYRPAALGFLARPALDAEDPPHVSGNYGLLDQQAAPRWIQTNALLLGGDPDRVTVFGQSAGANLLKIGPRT